VKFLIKKITWKLHKERIAAKVLRIFISIYHLPKNESSSDGTKLILYKALIRSILTYACPAWEFAVESYFPKLQRLQNKVLRTTGNLPRRTQTSNLHMSFKILYLYGFVTKLCREQATVILNHENVNIRNIGQGEARHRKYKRLKLVAVRHTINRLDQWLHPCE
jgi:hypothetical protein